MSFAKAVGALLVAATALVACASADEAPAETPPVFSGDYFGADDATIKQLTFFDDEQRYTLTRNEPCEKTGKDACFEGGTYTVDAKANVLRLRPYLEDHEVTLPFEVTKTSTDDSIESGASLTTKSLELEDTSLTNGTKTDLKPGAQVGAAKVGGELVKKQVELTCQRPPEKDCSFYSKCLEPAKTCGPKGYALGYGQKYCQRYFDNLSKFSAKGQQWVTYVGHCLQEAQVPKLASAGGMTCDALMKEAFASHVDCYIKGPVSICDLPMSDKLTIATKIIDTSDLFNMQTAIVGTECAIPGSIKGYMSPPSDD